MSYDIVSTDCLYARVYIAELSFVYFKMEDPDSESMAG